MIKKENIKELFRGSYTFEDIANYFIGMYRYKIYYTRFQNVLIRKHILEQIDFRIKYMDEQCLMEGSCKLCGCLTTALQMSNKACNKPCYPTMMNKVQWKKFFHKGKSFKDYKTGYIWNYKVNQLYKRKFKK